MRLRRPFVAVASAAVLAVVASVFAISGSATAQDAESGDALFIRSVDSATPASTQVRFLYSGSAPAVSDLTLTENGVAVQPTSVGPLAATTPINVALIFDTSAAAADSGTLANSQAAAKDWIRGRSPEQQSSMNFAVFAAADTGVLIQSYSNDEERLLAAIDRVGPAADANNADKTALWSAVRQAGNTLTEQTGQANIVIMTAQGDNASGGDSAAARGAVASANAAVFAVEYTGEGMDAATLQSLVNTNGGQLLATADAGEIEALVDDAGNTVSEGQFEIVYPTTVAVGQASELNLTVGDSSVVATSIVGGLTAGVPTLSLEGSTSADGIGALQSNLGLMLAVLLALLAVAALAYGVMLIFVKDDSLTRTLQPYTEEGGSIDDEDGRAPAMATSAIMQRAVELTEQVASDRGVLARAENSLERANLPLRAGEALFFYVAGVAAVTVLALVLTKSLIGVVFIGGIAILVPIATVNFIASSRRKKFTATLPDMLSLLSGTLRAGYSLMQGIEAVSQEVEEPMGQELRRVVTEARLGRPLEESLEGTAERMGSADFGWAVMAIRIQREVGGNLSELLLTVADTMTQRERLRRDVASLTAEGRMSAIVLGLLPIGLAGAMWTINPAYMGQLFSTTIGNIMLGVAVLAMGIGFFWMKKIIDIEI